MLSQQTYFRILSFAALFFFARTLCAVAPHKTGAQITDAYGAPYADGWDIYSIVLVCAVPLAISLGWKIVWSLIVMNSEQKQSRYDQ